MSCDPLDTVNRCPGALLCGTDKFCHVDGEAPNACEFEQNDAMLPADVAIRDAPPVDTMPTDAFTVCPGGAWQADFATDPTLAATHAWHGTMFDFTRDVAAMAWQPKVDKEALATTPAGTFDGVTTFQTRVTVGVIDSAHVILHLNAGQAQTSVDVQVDVSRSSTNQRYTVTVAGATTVSQSGVASVNPHLMIGRLDFQGHAFQLFLDDASGTPAVDLAFTPADVAPAQTYTVTADTSAIVDDLGVCSM